MSGLPGWNQYYPDGLYEQASGIETLRFSIEDEGFLSSASDTPANTPFLARIKNAKDFYIARSPKVWFQGDEDDGEGSIAAYARLEIDNTSGEFNFLIGADIRDSIVVFELPIAAAAGTLAGAPVMATAILDDILAPDNDTIIFVLKDTLARFDRPLRIRRIPTFMESGAVKRMVPMSFGACRNVPPLLIDAPNRLYLLHDGVITNVAVVRDQYAPLDPSIPQYTPALNGSGIQLETEPFGKVTVDCSSEGAQVVIPGAEDVLAGIGVFDPWAGAVPDGWDWSNFAGSVLTKLDEATNGYPIGSGLNIASIGSARPWSPFNARFGDYLSVTGGTPLKSGRSYRVNFKIWSTFGAEPFFVGGLPAGIMLRSAISNNPDDAISPHGLPLTVRLGGNNSYTFTHRVPVGVDRNVYLIGVSAQGNSGTAGMGVGGGLIYDVAIEELGEFTELPLRGTTLVDYFKDVLHDRAGEVDSYEEADLEYLDDPDVAGYTFGIHFDEQPNILRDMLQPVVDSFGGFMVTDALGKIRVRQFVAPELATIVAAFNLSCIDRNSIYKRAFNAGNFTTQIGSTHNCVVGTDGDMVSDTVVLPQDARNRYQRISQYLRTSSINPAQEYAHAVGAPPFNSLLDKPDEAEHLINRLTAAMAPRIVNGVVLTGKLMLVDFDVVYEGLSMGIGPTIAPNVILEGDGVTLNTVNADGINEDGFVDTPMVILGSKRYLWGEKMTLTCVYADTGEP